MTQSEEILRYMELAGSITPAVAYEEIGCLRLAARISDLRKRGYKIASEYVTRKNRWGRKVTFCRYRLEEAENATH